MTGPVLSIFMVTLADLLRPAWFVAEQVSVMPGVSAVSTDVPQPEEEAMPDSGSVTPQFKVTSAVYHPLEPDRPLPADSRHQPGH